MYITYKSGQKTTDPVHKKLWLDSIGGTFRPRWLIRVSDWEKVPGSEAASGYCAISYSWEQSGELITTVNGEIDCIDEGKHRLITMENVTHRTRRSTRLRRHSIVTLVPFTKILQKICQDFRITYLWYDKVCIDQMNKAERIQEIKQMYQIYGNARFTVALIPEIRIANPCVYKQRDPIFLSSIARSIAMQTIRTSSWWKRAWTLEELMMSKRILIVGTNAQVWMQTPIDNWLPVIPDFMTTMLNSQNTEVKSANQVFRFAQFRTSSKQHDKVFSLLNVFQGTIPINVTYKSDISDTIKHFFRSLVEQDLSILCFGSVRDRNWGIFYHSELSCYNLPSWTGVSGRHTHDHVKVISLQQGTQFTDDNMRLHIQCKYFTIRPVSFSDTTFYLQKDRSMAVNERKVKVNWNFNDIPTDDPIFIDALRWEMLHESNCIVTHSWESDHPAFYPTTALSLTEDCDEVVILSIIYVSSRMKFDSAESGYKVWYELAFFLPVLKKSVNGDTYKAVGIALIKKYTVSDPQEDPSALLDNLFNSRCKEFKEIIIE